MKIYDIAKEVYHNNMYGSLGSAAFEYIKSRGISEQLINQNRIGCTFLGHKNGITKYLSNRFSIEELINSKLTIDHDKYGTIDFFWFDMIIFPVIDLDGNTIHFTSRAISRKNSIHKHLQIPLDCLYNFNNFDPNEKEIYLVEGPIDCLSLQEFGFKNTLATFGTCGLKDSTCQRIPKSCAVNIIFDDDSNESGLKGALRASRRLLANNIDEIYIVHLLGRESGQKKIDCNDLLLRNDGYELLLKSLSKKKHISQFDIRVRKSEYRKYKYDEENLNIEDLINQYAHVVRKYGDRISAFCPFHDDVATPSLVGYIKTQSFNCFGCGLGGPASRFKYLISKNLIGRN